jgi:hypothetical protein
LSLDEVHPPSPWIDEFPVLVDVVSDEPVNHLALKGTTAASSTGGVTVPPGVVEMPVTTRFRFVAGPVVGAAA